MGLRLPIERVRRFEWENARTQSKIARASVLDDHVWRSMSSRGVAEGGRGAPPLPRAQAAGDVAAPGDVELDGVRAEDTPHPAPGRLANALSGAASRC